VYIGYNEQLAHRIEAGADALLMPSRFEPCGLNQIYSQMYGTVPIVRRTGGLADTVIDFSAATLADHTATGFCFDEDSPEALLATCLGALSLYRNQRIDWWKLAIAGMQRDFSWAASAARYSELYQRLGQRTDGPRQPLSLEQLGGLPTDTGSRPNAQRLH
jgi:starch synthase